jgi:hypothetical protein
MPPAKNQNQLDSHYSSRIFYMHFPFFSTALAMRIVGPRGRLLLTADAISCVAPSWRQATNATHRAARD